MTLSKLFKRNNVLSAVGAGAIAVVAFPAFAGAEAEPGTTTFTKDIAPILQRSCESCHRPGGGAPMSLITYQDVRAVGPLYQATYDVARDAALVHRQEHRHPALQGRPVADRGGDCGDRSVGRRWSARRATRPICRRPREWPAGKWTIGEPDLVVQSPVATVEALAADWFGGIDPPLTNRVNRRSVDQGGRGQRGDSR